MFVLLFSELLLIVFLICLNYRNTFRLFFRLHFRPQFRLFQPKHDQKPSLQFRVGLLV
jgi:hypothetical protein